MKQPENFIKTLDSLKKEYKTNRVGYHQQTYRVMASAMPVALLLRSNKKLKRKFLRHVKSKRSSGGVPINIVTEVMFYVAGATSESARKIAWKRGRVIEFLHDQGIKIARIASEIKSRGGIGAVLKQATKEDPRREKISAGKTASGKTAKALLAKISDKQDRDEFDGVNATSPATAPPNDGQVIMPVLINLSDREMLFELPAGSRARIVATRINQKGAKIVVNRVKPRARKSEDDGAWD